MHVCLGIVFDRNDELISYCLFGHTENPNDASNPLSALMMTYSYFEWIGCFSHLLNLCITDLFKNEEFKQYFDISNKYLDIYFGSRFLRISDEEDEKNQKSTKNNLILY